MILSAVWMKSGRWPLRKKNLRYGRCGEGVDGCGREIGMICCGRPDTHQMGSGKWEAESEGGGRWMNGPGKAASTHKW